MHVFMYKTEELTRWYIWCFRVNRNFLEGYFSLEGFSRGVRGFVLWCKIVKNVKKYVPHTFRKKTPTENDKNGYNQLFSCHIRVLLEHWPDSPHSLSLIVLASSVPISDKWRVSIPNSGYFFFNPPVSIICPIKIYRNVMDMKCVDHAITRLWNMLFHEQIDRLLKNKKYKKHVYLFRLVRASLTAIKHWEVGYLGDFSKNAWVKVVYGATCSSYGFAFVLLHNSGTFFLQIALLLVTCPIK